MNSVNAEANERSNMIFQWCINKLILVLFLRYPEVAQTNHEKIKGNFSKKANGKSYYTNHAEDTQLFGVFSPQACWKTCVDCLMKSLKNLKHAIFDRSEFMQTLEAEFSSYLDSDEVDRYLIGVLARSKAPALLNFKWHFDEGYDYFECEEIRAVVMRLIGFPTCDDSSYQMAKSEYLEGKWYEVICIVVIITTF